MLVALILLLVGAGITGWIFLWSRQRQHIDSSSDFDITLDAVPGREDSDAVLVSREHGQLVYINRSARAWFGMNSGEPNLELVTRQIRPSDNFLELFARESQTAFQVGDRWVEAVSHRIPAGTEMRTVIVMRELTENGGHNGNGNGTTSAPSLDLSLAMKLINDIGENVDSRIGIEENLQVILTIIRQSISYDAGEINLYDSDSDQLRPRGWIGDAEYLIKLTEVGGNYGEDEGITGWIARHHKPILYTTADHSHALNTKVVDNPYHSIVGVPLLIGSKLLGTLELASQKPYHFSQRELALLQAISRSVSIAIHHATLYAEQVRRVDDITSIQAVVEENVPKDATNEIYDALTRRIAILADASICGVFLLDEGQNVLIPMLPFQGVPDLGLRNLSISLPADSKRRTAFFERSAWITNSVSDDPAAELLGLMEMVNLSGARNMAWLPVAISGNRIGMIIVGNKTNGFTHRDLQNLRVLSGQAAVVIENLRLHSREMRIDAELAGLQEMSFAIGSLSHEVEFYGEITRRVARLMNVGVCGVFIFDEASQEFISRTPFRGVPDELAETVSWPLTPGTLFEQMWSGNEQVWEANIVSTNPVAYQAGIVEFTEQAGIDKIAIAMMSVGGRSVGLLVVGNPVDNRDFSQQDSRLLLIFATQAATIIENARLFGEVRRNTEQAEELRRIAEIAGKITREDDILTELLSRIANFTDSPMVFVSLMEPSGELITYPQWVHGRAMDAPVKYDVYAPGFEHSVTMSQRAFLSNDLNADERVLPAYRQVSRQFGLKRTVMVPLVIGDRSLGEMGIANCETPYTNEDIAALNAIASQIAAALDRLHMVRTTADNLRRREEELEAISRVSQVLGTTLEFDPVLRITAEVALRATGAEGVTIVMLRPQNKWRRPEQPEMARRYGDDYIKQLTDIELEAVARGADSVLVSDYTATDMEPQPFAARSALAASIFYVDRVVGVIHLYHSRPQQFDERAASFMLTLAAKAALGYGNQVRFEAEQERSASHRRRADQLNRIFELGHMMQTGNTEPQTISEAVVFSVQQAARFDVVLMLLVDREAEVLRRVAQAGMPISLFEQTRHSTVDLTALDKLLVEDYRISESYFLPVEDVRDWYNEEVSALSPAFDGNRTLSFTSADSWRDGDMLLVPMTGASGDLIGLMSLDRPFDNERPTRNTIEVLEIFAHQATTMMENSRLYLSSVRDREQETRLNTIMESISANLDVTRIIESMITNARHLLDYDTMTVALLDSDQRGFEVARATVTDGEVVIKRDRHLPLERTAMGQTYLTKEPIVYEDGDTEILEAFEDVRGWHEEGARTGFVLPLLTGGQSVGVFHVGTSKRYHPDFLDSQSLMQRMGQLVAASIQNARLFDEAVNLRVLNESVVESLQQGIIVLNSSGRVISINEFMRERYGWDNNAVGQDLFDYSPEIEHDLAGVVQEVLEQGVPQNRSNVVTIEEDGSEVVRNYYLYPLHADEIVRGAVVLVEDVTVRAKLERDMEARANQLAALTEVSKRITSSLERDEVIGLTMAEMAWLLQFDRLTLWRRNGSFVVLEGISDPESYPEIMDGEIRVRITDYPRIKSLIDTQRAVNINYENGIDTPLIGEDGARSWLGVPLVSQGHVVGMLVLVSQEIDKYNSPSDQNIGLALASQVAIALANADLFQQTFDRTNELSILLEAAQATSASQDLEQIFNTISDLMFNALEMDQCAIMTWVEVDDAVEVEFDVNRNNDKSRSKPVGTRYDLKQYKGKRQALTERDVIVIAHDDPETPYPIELDELRQSGDAARMLVPLIGHEGPIGLIQLEQHEVDERQMTQQKVRLARALGSQVAGAIESARLSNEMSQLFTESLIVNDLSRAITSTLKVEDMIDVVAREVPRLTGSDELYLALYDAEQDLLTFPAAVRGTERFHIPARPLGNDEVSFIIKRRRPLSIGADYFSPDELRQSMGIENGEGNAKSYMGVPLVAGDTTVGVLALRDTKRTRAFTVNDQRILNIVGAQLGVAIQNARLFDQISDFADSMEVEVEARTEELEQERDRIDTLYQITSELSRTLDMDRLLQRGLGMVSKAVEASDGVIFGIEPLNDELFVQATLAPFPKDEHHPATSIAAWLLANQETTIRIDNLHAFEGYDNDALGAEDWGSALAAILETTDNDPLGVIVLLRPDTDAFNDSQERLLMAAANQVAASINNSDLYHLIRDQAERLGKLLRDEQEEAEKNSSILESIADGVILSNSEGRIILFNNAAETILQVPRDQIINQPITKFIGIYGDESTRWTKAIQEQTMYPDRDVLRGFHNERTTLGDRTVSVQLSTVYTGDKFLGIVSVFRDITMDVAVDRMKSEFVSNVSHELRTPLTPIKGYTDLLLMGATGELNDGQKRIMQTIKENVERLTVLVEDVLDISKIDSGRERLKVEPVGVPELVANILENLQSRPQHQRKELTVTTQFSDDFPVIQADPGKLNRIISNIVDNAFNYTLSGGSIDIGGYLEADAKRVVITIHDTGVGIPEEFREEIWRRFQRFEEHALTLDVAGTGLGLSIVREMIEMHGGDVWFESEVGVGTTFFVALPVDQPDFLSDPAYQSTKE